jgi:hypothetical protein
MPRYSAERVARELGKLADRLDVVNAKKRDLELKRAEWLQRGLEAGPKENGRAVSYRDMAAWARITSSRVSQILQSREPEPAPT